LPPTGGSPSFLSYLAIALCVSGCITDGGWSMLLPRANSMFLAGGPPPSDRAGDDNIKYVPNESSSVEHLCCDGCCAGGDSRPLPVPLRPPPRSNILDICSIVSFFGDADLRLCRLTGAKLCGAGLISFLASAGTERHPDSLMADFTMVTSPTSPYSLVVDVKAPPGRWWVCTSFVVKEITLFPKENRGTNGLGFWEARIARPRLYV
jgi:hypothetical protein